MGFAAGSPAFLRSALDVERRVVDEVMSRARSEVDLGSILGASRNVAAVLDRAVPALRAAANDRSVPTSSTPCDVLDLQGIVCVGGGGSSEYEDPYLGPARPGG